MTKRRRKQLYLDRPTSHGGWGPESDNGSWNNKKPVYQQISDYLTTILVLDYMKIKEWTCYYLKLNRALMN